MESLHDACRGDGGGKIVRIRPKYIGIARHMNMIGGWSKAEGSLNLDGLFSGMSEWGRSMPSPEEFLRYLDLAKRYQRTDPNLCFSQVEICDALETLNDTADGKMLKQGVLPALSARDIAATILKGFARYRDLRITSKFLTVGRRCTPQQRDLLMQFVDGFSGVGSIPHDAIDDAAQASQSVAQASPGVHSHLSRSSSRMSVLSDISSSETPRKPCIDDAWPPKPCTDDAWDELEMLFSMPSTLPTSTTTTITTTHTTTSPAHLAVDTLIRRIRGHTFALGRGNSFFMLMGSGGGGFSLATEGEQGDAGGTIYCTQG